MQEFLEGIVKGLYEEPDPRKKDWKYHCFEEILLKYGKFMKPMPIDSDSDQGFAVARHCYYNSQQVAFNSQLIYCEGYAISSKEMPVPVAHAWVKDQNLAVELTWNQPGFCYFGIPFNPEWLQNFVKERSEDNLMVMTYDCLNSINLLRYGLSESALIGI
jgi:hypothetical protein